MRSCARCHVETARLYPSDGVVRWCGPCWSHPAEKRSALDPAEVGSKTAWKGGRAGKDSLDPDGFDLHWGYENKE